MTRIPAWLSGVIMLVVLVLGTGYLTVGVLRIDPLDRRRTLVIDTRETGGLRAGSEVVYRGVNIGRIDRVDAVAGGVRIALSYSADYRIPRGSAMKVENLSALGEPVFAFLPAGTGEALPDGAHLAGRDVEFPLSVPELLESTAALFDQADPTVLARLVHGYADAVADAGTLAPTLDRAADLLAATLVRYRPEIAETLANLHRIMPHVDWVGPTLLAAPPQLEAFGDTLGVSYEYLFEGSALLRGKEIMGSWRAEEDRLVDFLRRLSPELGALGVALRPVSSAVGPLLGEVDTATLLEYALATLPGDRVRIELSAPGGNPGTPGER